MEYKTATLVPLGRGHISKVTGVHESIGSVLEARTLAHGYCFYDVWKLTLMEDGRIAVERENLPVETITIYCQCDLCKHRRENDRALEEEVIPPNIDFPHAICMEDMHEPPEEAK